ncbi:hypothetical protein CcrC1_gp008 [Caulobacter phage C1]|nr:hypothetical protein CcrC1_gp501 [Caulobacter phage C1]UTU08236.1 hypothetical protein CcrC2_gp486 [Caulobacter phage C2]UTU08759.1 hypothetical protein CcrJ4_gp499 [Caulobacter phage J4]UTU09295.1 hypothetical protein CcrBL47_gp525 [Caulobacter phage BL47]UTU09871.1 hypothetical protein CcrRB23_gp504 [Caulobacter phage RB23]WGN96895.1 hypothetical protein [Bertelyvirus sp.]
MFILIVGNPVDGYAYYGPFHDHDDATNYAENTGTEGNPWWVAPLEEAE